MKMRLMTIALVIGMITCGGYAGLHAEIAWQETNTWAVDGQPLQVSHSKDGKWTFVLTDSGNIFVFSEKGELQGKIPVDASVTGMDISRKGDVLFLIDRQKKNVRVLDIEFIQDINITNAPFMGPAEALVTLVVFSDFQCPGCGKLAAVLEQVLDEYPENVKIVFKNFPLAFHQFATPAARAALAALGQGRFWEFHDLLFANASSLNPNLLLQFATQLGLDVNQFQRDMGSADTADRVEEDIKDGKMVDVTSTPSLFINGRRQKERTLQAIKTRIEEELEKKKSQ
jgi:protein-disulfide isomerase